MVAPFELRTRKEVEQPRIDFDGLRRGRTGWLGTWQCQRAGELDVLKVRGEVTLEANIFVEVSDDRNLEAGLGAEIAGVNVEVSAESEVTVGGCQR